MNTTYSIPELNEHRVIIETMHVINSNMFYNVIIYLDLIYNLGFIIDRTNKPLNGTMVLFP